MTSISKILAILFMVTMASCSGGGGGSGDRGPSAANEPASDPSPEEQKAGDVASIGSPTLSTNEIFTSGGGSPNCAEFSVILKDAGDLFVEGAIVTYEAQYQGEAPEAGGSFELDQVLSDIEGKATVKFCAGKDEFEVVIVAKVGEISQNSAVLKAQQKGAYQLSFAGSSLLGMVEEGEKVETINLNFFNAGPNDCIFLYFQLLYNGESSVGKTIGFKTPFDLPVGVKLAERKLDRELETDANTGKQRAVFSATSSSEGILSVPVCSGTALGSFNVSGSFEDEDGNTVVGESPTISVVGGLPSYANFTLTFNEENARTLQGFFNTNSDYILEVAARVQSRSDGDAITTSPVSVATETGRLTLLDDGKVVGGESKFSLQALHMNNYYAYSVYPFDTYPQARSRCDPAEIASSLGGSGDFSFYDLSKNWRSTIVYQTQGQEHYFDRNGDGSYGGDGDGFWDKNQNGVFDSGVDELTFDSNGNGSFDYSGEWFLDLPSPFIDVDENMQYDASIDILLAESYVGPNGKRDNDNLIWKSEVFPIYMGMSFYGLLREKINHNVNADPADFVSGDDGTIFGKNYSNPIVSGEFFTDPSDLAANAAQASVRRHFFLHGACGNLLPGGTVIEASVNLKSGAEYGLRTPIVYYRADPLEQRLDGARALLNGTGSASATVNFNSIDHPNANRGYPLPFDVELPACTSACSGAVATPGVACSGATYEVATKVAEPEFFGSQQYVRTIEIFATYPESKTCVCASGVGGAGNAKFLEGNCECPTNTSFDGTNCVLDE